MITKHEALDAIAVKHGHKDWELARYRLGERHLDVLILEAMDLYAEQSNSHKPVVSGKRPSWENCAPDTCTMLGVEKELCECYQAACSSGAAGTVAERRISKHVCGAQGYNPMLGDTCEGCENR